MQEMARAFGLLPPSLGEGHIRPARKAILQIPLRLPVADKDKIGHSISQNER